ncbi:MAG: hypothetical protein JKY61_05575 [Planctomycetes bacterium]|nr:hypothetical protein [Planctomycetota bacterium]
MQLLRSGDPNTRIHELSPTQILDLKGFPSYLLGSSAKIEKSKEIGVLSRVLYFTPGIFCSAADTGCLLACLGHTSGRMGLPDSFTARDKRSAFFLKHEDAFIERLKAEIHLLKADSLLHGLRPAVRLNGSSDLAWERRFPEVFQQFPDVEFYDYTKIFPRAMQALGARPSSVPWPENYRLTYSAGSDDRLARQVLESGGTVAVVFHPNIPSSWLGAQVLDGDVHDVRYLDPGGSVVGLKAKGIAKVDVTGFTRRPCPDCGPEHELQFLLGIRRDGTVRTKHSCDRCRSELEASIRDPYRNRLLPDQSAHQGMGL